MDRGKLVISLDFELHWGIFEKAPIDGRVTYFDNTIEAIPKILNLFSTYNIEATWATVGMLFNKNLSDLKTTYPSHIPSYKIKELSSYEYILKNDAVIKKYPKYYFATKLIEKINSTKGQEIASHTYSHYYCLENGQNQADFRQDLQLNIDKAKEIGITLKSIVFPRNQYNSKYNSICIELGIKALRSNPNVWFWNATTKESLLKKVFRTADCYIPLHNSLYKLNSLQVIEGLPLLIPASRFLRPISKYDSLNKLRLKRIKKEMTKAAKLNKVYHLWWHPHNFGSNPNAALKELEELLRHFKHLNDRYKMRSMNMKSIYKQFYK